MTRVHTIVLLLGLITVSAMPARADDRAQKLAERALRLTDAGRVEEAIRTWDSAVAVAPDVAAYRYERVLCHVMLERYDQALQDLRPIYRDTNLYDRGYQLMGNICDLKGDSVQSMQFYKEGFAKWPNSGRLHYEFGAAAKLAGRTQEAIDWWAKGVKVEPDFATNYYWVAKSFAKTANKIWTLIYGEAFLNLERGSKRTQEISKLLFDTWNAGFRLGDTTDPMHFCSDELLEQPGPRGVSTMSFPMAFEFCIALASQHLIPETGVKTRLSMAELVEVRKRFLTAWKKQGFDSLYTNTLLDWENRVAVRGYLTEYFYWIYSYGDDSEMTAWFRSNEKKFDTFLGWYGSEPLSIQGAPSFGL